MTATDLIAFLELKPLPMEGGYFRETYRSPCALADGSLPRNYSDRRSLSTAIYFLLTSDTFSAMHRLPADEIYHFYGGDPVEMLQLTRPGVGETILLGQDLKAGMRPQVLVPALVWQGSRLVLGGQYALLGTTMAPGFDFADLTLGSRRELVREYPMCTKLIKELTRDD